MESALYGIHALVVFVSENSLVRYAHSFVFWYANNSSVNTVRAHFPWSNLYIFPRADKGRSRKKILAKPFAGAIGEHYRDFEHAYVYWIWLRGSASYVIIDSFDWKS